MSKHFGKDKRGRTRGVGSSVSRTRLKYTEPFRDEFQKVKDDVAKSNDIMGDMRADISRILNHLQVYIYIYIYTIVRIKFKRFNVS